LTLLTLLDPLAANAAWERQYICFDPSSFIGIGAYDETHASANGQIKTTGDNPFPVVMYTNNGKTWDEGAFTQPANMLFTFPLFLEVPSRDIAYLVLATMIKGLPPKPQADFESSTNLGGTFLLSKTPPASAVGVTPKAMYYTDKLNGWVLGVSGSSTSGANWIAGTQDGGKTWNDKGVIAYEQDISYSKIFFINDRFGWLAGGDEGEFDSDTGEQTRNAGRGVIQYTTDGGKTWTKAVSEAPYLFESIAFSDCLNGWASATDNYKKARLFKTTNGGRRQADWQEVTLPKYVDKKSDYTSISAIRFFDANDGWAIAYVMSMSGKSRSYLTNLLHTTDGGKNWTNDSTYIDAAKASNGSPCCFQEIQPAICTGGMVPLAAAGAGGFAMTWPSRNTGWVTGSNAIIMKYTADTPNTAPVHRCAACCGGKCPGDPDGGYTTSCGETDGGAPDAQVDSGGMPDAANMDASTDDSGSLPDAGKDGGTKKDGGGEDSLGGCSCGTVENTTGSDGIPAIMAGVFLLMLAFLRGKRIISRRKDQSRG
jgi:photosystem II stability/assembly factor-like uncharacterized protein